MNQDDWAARIRSGDRRALAQALTLVENRRPEGRAIVSSIYPYTGHCTIVGLTGPPGVGKSTLVDALADRVARQGRRVAILAIDPSSPFSGGALLGDRARMERGSRSPDIFIRSMATRGHVGGLSASAFEAVALFEAAGNDLLFVETVGAGQDEVEIAAAAGLTVVVMAPGLGDELQSSKAGLAEIAEILVVNKADREGADRLVSELTRSLSSGRKGVPVLTTVATTGEGVNELLDAIGRLGRSSSRGSGERRKKFARGWLRQVVLRALEDRVPEWVWEDAVQSVLDRSTDPFTAAERLLESAFGNKRTVIGVEANDREDNDGGEVMKIDHLAIAVDNLDEAAARFEELLGLRRAGRYDVPEQKVSVLFLPVGGSRLELLEPQSEDSPVGKFLAKHGEGLHHVCLEVNDIETRLRELQAKGAELIDKKPRRGAEGHLVAFIHPKSTHGVLVELKQK